MMVGELMAPTPGGKPGYAPEIDMWLRDTLGLDPASAVAELGAGGGNFTAHIRRLCPQSIAVEPDKGKRAAFSRNQPTARVVAGSAEQMPIATEALDCLLVAQAFHWFANKTALAEISRVLKPDGTLALIWNIRDESVAWVRQLSRLIEPLAEDVPRFHMQKWQQTLQEAGFQGVSKHRFCHTHKGPAHEVVLERILSVRFVARQPKPLREKLRRDLMTLIEKTPELSDRASCHFPYVTMAYRFSRH